MACVSAFSLQRITHNGPSSLRRSAQRLHPSPASPLSFSLSRADSGALLVLRAEEESKGSQAVAVKDGEGDELAVRKEELLKCRDALRDLIDETAAFGILIRAAWHDAGTYDAKKEGEWPKKGGANGSIRFPEETSHAANAGLDNAIKLLQPIKDRFQSVSWADILQMASAVAIEMAGGPKIAMQYGRVDVDSPEDCPKEGNLPDGAAPFGDGAETPAQHLRNVFYRMGLDDQEIVALSGAHTVGRAWKNRSGFGRGEEGTNYTTGEHTDLRQDGKGYYGKEGGMSWTPRWLLFDNSYFTAVNADDDPELLKLQTDTCLFADEAFRPYALKYADSQEAFFADYSAAHKKLSELGSKFDPPEGITLD
ncbi:unnamed protein product [Vitrella brassicaformis CCMP3155]|uniref:Plant heme peroxidase family profile domain-containing protein n=2 Tax=Vitrella brassicaformis TaxID=1169539 RepID=A0A0G4GHU2_VITBC|nr:unnamed protein product [Vitrella brassicaformis CCMP3155]|eukprot:CEM29166.1 unnamed protein product [Vitrella brassicaformis CCMP3155]